MEIIKNGIYVDKFTHTCDRCDCKFSYTRKETTSEFLKDQNLYNQYVGTDNEWKTHKTVPYGYYDKTDCGIYKGYIHCPQCNKILEIPLENSTYSKAILMAKVKREVN